MVGCGTYGMAIGLWRDPRMAAYVGIKLPLLIFLTLTVNGFLNGMLAQALGSGLSFRQTLLGCLMSFTVFALIVGSLSPLVAFMIINSPDAGAQGAEQWHALILLTNVFVVGLAGIVGNVKFFHTLREFTSSRIVALRVLGAWLAGNLFVGAQLSWNLRPMLGNPALNVQFLRDEPFRGNFYQDVFKKVQLASGYETDVAIVLLGALALIAGGALYVAWILAESRLREADRGDSPMKKN